MYEYGREHWGGGGVLQQVPGLELREPELRPQLPRAGHQGAASSVLATIYDILFSRPQ